MKLIKFAPWPALQCPHCGEGMTLRPPFTPESIQPGDVALCTYCERALRFESRTMVRLLRMSEAMRLPRALLDQLVPPSSRDPTLGMREQVTNEGLG